MYGTHIYDYPLPEGRKMLHSRVITTSRVASTYIILVDVHF